MNKKILFLLVSILLILSACSESGEYECQQCGKSTNTLYDDYYCAECFLQSDEYYKCPNCGEYFTSDRFGSCGLVQHSSPFPCTYCDYCCSELHKYECSVCNERFGGDYLFYVNDLTICTFCFEDFTWQGYISANSLERDIKNGIEAETEFWSNNTFDNIEPKI